jgi:indole-3-glycerol phosphate synthase/phosphoribosylanthranilate isomerase
MDFLSEIIGVKSQRVAAAKASCPLDRMRELAHRVRREKRGHALLESLRGYRGANIIAEFKRRSPSKGKINSKADPATLAQIYQSAGAAAVSCLTEEDYFDGSLDDLRRIREAIRLPLLRKDFILDEYQVYESAFVGADAILLIVAALDDPTLAKLRAIAEEELGMDALVEVHTDNEFDRALKCGARLIGVNNRDLRTFNVSIDTSKSLARLARRNTILVSESGLTPEVVRELGPIGYHAFLVGETLMRANDPGVALREFVNAGTDRHPHKPWVKICGITSAEDARAAIQAGADMLGFNFYPPSPRFITADAAAAIIRDIQPEIEGASRSVSMVGVFVNESVDAVTETADAARLDGIQLHGDETFAYCLRLRELSPQRFIIKAMRAHNETNLEELKNYPADAIMVDAFDRKLRGGTGKVADWEIARMAARNLPRLFLAGGLSPENVGDAIANVRPYAVDACSALETEPGRKSAARMKEFVDAVRSSKLPDEISVSGEGD